MSPATTLSSKTSVSTLGFAVSTVSSKMSWSMSTGSSNVSSVISTLSSKPPSGSGMSTLVKNASSGSAITVPWLKERKDFCFGGYLSLSSSWQARHLCPFLWRCRGFRFCSMESEEESGTDCWSMTAEGGVSEDTAFLTSLWQARHFCPFLWAWWGFRFFSMAVGDGDGTTFLTGTGANNSVPFAVSTRTTMKGEDSSVFEPPGFLTGGFLTGGESLEGLAGVSTARFALGFGGLGSGICLASPPVSLTSGTLTGLARGFFSGLWLFSRWIWRSESLSNAISQM